MNPDEHVWGRLKAMFRKEPITAGEIHPEVLAAELADDLEAALAQFAAIAGDLRA
jgi:hypothetical protein